MPAVRPEYGPSLAELLAPRLRALPRAAQAALVLACAGAVVLLAWLALGGGGEKRIEVVVREPIAFNFVHQTSLVRAPLQPGELVSLRGAGASAAGPDAPQRSFTVRPLRLEPYTGDNSGVLTGLAGVLIIRMREADPAFEWRGDGRFRVNRQPGYEISYQTRRDGRRVYGKRVLLLPDVPGAREGIDVTLLEDRSAAVPSVQAVGRNGPLKVALRSLRFGTERP
jgi:hypothetical protein